MAENQNRAPLIPFGEQELIDLVSVEMPFGKHKGTVIIDLPEAYLLWFAKKEFPSGRLGFLMKLALQTKIEGSESAVKKLKTLSR
ncbi:MAG: DUF3820 family protein [Pseudomonadota bacterium]